VTGLVQYNGDSIRPSRNVANSREEDNFEIY